MTHSFQFGFFVMALAEPPEKRWRRAVQLRAILPSLSHVKNNFSVKCCTQGRRTKTAEAFPEALFVTENDLLKARFRPKEFIVNN